MEAFFEYLKTMPIPFNFVAIVGMFAILCGVIYACYTAYLNNALKREMLNKGMSAGDIERVINAGKNSPEIEDQPSEQGAASHAASQRP
jgi:hypothetical protein